MEPAGVLLGATSLVLGGVLKGATGAGAPILAVPLLAMLYDVPFAVATLLVPNLASNVWQGWRYRAHRAPAPLTWGFAAAGIAGAGLGSLLLVTLDPGLLLALVAFSVFLYIAFRLARPDWRLGMGPATRLAVPVGAVAGLLQGASGVSAPVSITFLNATRMERPAFIATISIFFLGMTLVQIPLLAAWGVLNAERALISVAALVPLFAGMPLGARLARRVSREAFDRAILALLALVALRLLYAAWA